MTDLTNHIRAYAAKNALEYGKADAGRILPKLFQHGLDRKDIGKIMPQIQKIVSEVNSLGKEELVKTVEELKEYVKEREEKEKTLPELPNAIDGKVVTRLSPDPSKYLHAGHAFSYILNYLYSQRYHGKCLLRFEDANPEKVSQEYVDKNIEDIKNYLKINYDSVRYVSDDIPLMYKHAETLIKKESAYMCFCSQEKMQKLRHEGRECECRKQKKEANLSEWNAFLKGKYLEGKATLRFKGNMNDQNQVLRDPVLFRAVHAKHYRHGTEYKVWPTFDFYSPIEDSIMGVTHILRTNEFDLRVPLQNMIKDLLGLQKQTVVQYGRVSIVDDSTAAKASGRQLRALVESGKYIGWDDPRLVTLKALRRRGIKVEVLYEMVNLSGLNQKETNVDFDMIAAMSRKMIDAQTARYSFVMDPVPLTIEHTAESKKITSVEVPIHPDKPETRKIKVGEVYISANDKKENSGREIRLLHLYNIELPKKGPKANVTSIENKAVPKIQWVSDYVPVKVFMPDATWSQGYAESAIKELKIGEVVQFERFGFVKLDKINKGIYEFWFTHK
jgi:glutamyl-tRNA synthetase